MHIYESWSQKLQDCLKSIVSSFWMFHQYGYQIFQSFYYLSYFQKKI